MTADLHDLLEDAVSDVEPRDRLAAIRARTRAGRRRRHRTALWGGSAVLAAACAVVAVVVGTGTDPLPDDVADDPAAPTATDSAAAEPDGNPTRAVALYFVGDTPAGPRLFREFRRVPYDDEHELDTENPTSFVEVLRALEAADDPDYRTEVALEGTVAAAIVEGGLRVHLDSPQSRLAAQQIVYTLRAATDGRVPIALVSGSGGGGVDPDPDVLADFSISDPVEGRTVRGSFTARGVALSPEGNVPWRIEDDGGRVVAEGFATAPGSYDQLNAWETRIEVPDLAPGPYTFVASTDDPSGGTEGFGPTSDTRTIVVE